LPGGSLNISRLEMYIYLLHAVGYGEKTMKTITYKKRTMVKEAKEAMRWAANSHEAGHTDLKVNMLYLALLYGDYFVRSAARYVDAVVEEAA